MYRFAATHHHIILTHAVLVALTPLIPIPLLDDWVKNHFLRRMMQQLAAARQVAPTAAQIEALLQEDFWDNCVEGCLGILFYILRELLSKIFFIVEWRRAYLLLGATYYTGFLIDAALQDGYPLASADGSVEAAAKLRDAVRRARYQANLRLFQRLVRENIRPLAFLRAGGTMAVRAVAGLPRLLIALPGAAWRGIRAAPGQVSRGASSFWARLRAAPRRTRENLGQPRLRKERPGEARAVERIVQALQAALEKSDHRHFDELHARLRAELGLDAPAPAALPPTT